jgi:hypothetical protein
MRIRFARGDDFLVDDAGPDGGERKEDADDGKDLDAELGRIIAELKAREDGWGMLVDCGLSECDKGEYLG